VNARFRVDSRGQLTPENAEAQKSLSAMAGNFYLLPTSPDLLAFVRSPSSGGRINPPRVVLAGDAAGFPLSDLIAFLAQSRWTGVIRVHAPTGERSVSMKDGEVRSATSDDPTDRLGEVMVRLGFVDRRKLEEVLKDTPPSKVGRALVERGLLQAHDLFKCLTHQLAEIFHAMVLTHEGTFMLVDQEVDDRSTSSHMLQLSTQSLLMDAIRKIDEMAHFRKRIPHGRMYVGKKRASDGKLEEDEVRVLGSLTGDKTVFELGQFHKMSEFDITTVVFRLLEGGYAMVSEKPVTGGLTAAVDAAVAPGGKAEDRLQKGDPNHVARVFNLIFKEIRDEVAKQGMEREFVAAANAALAGEALSSSPVLQGQSFDPSGVLPEAALLEQFQRTRDQLGAEPVVSLRKALSDVMFFLLFQAGELLESRADEDLARRVKELLATLEQ
jgi:uncharacterized protein DUF4388